jgi:hypothetical protein
VTFVSSARPPRVRRAYDHRLREHVVRCGAKAIARHVQIPRSTVSSWRRRGLRPVVTTEPVGEDLQHALESRTRWEKQARVLAAVVRLLLALLRASCFRLDGNRLPAGEAKAGILRAVSSAEPFLSLAIILRILGLESSRYHAWRRAESACVLDDRPSCPHTSPAQLTAGEVATIKDMVLAPEHRHMPLGTLARYAQRIGARSSPRPRPEPSLFANAAGDDHDCVCIHPSPPSESVLRDQMRSGTSTRASSGWSTGRRSICRQRSTTTRARSWRGP